MATTYNPELGYETGMFDPSAYTDQTDYQQPQRQYGSTGPFTDPAAGADGADDWFSSNLPAMSPPTPSYTAAPERPGYLQNYQAPTWQGGDFQAPGKPGALGKQFTAPTLQDLLSSPGYLAQQDAIQRGQERAAAGKGSILSGGFNGIVLPRALAEGAARSYGDLYNRALSTRGQQFGEYRADVGDALEQYKSRYQSFVDSANLGAQARGINENAYQNDVASNRNASNDYWQQQQDVFGNTISSLDLQRPPAGGA